MKGLVIASLLCFAAFLKIHAQDFLSWQYNDRYFSVQVGSGTSTYFGDLKHNDNIKKALSNVNLGIEARLLSKVSARAQLTYYDIKGTDRKAADSTYAQQRNLSFYSKNWELNLNGVFYLKKYQGDYYKRWKWDPYLFAGLGLTYFNPKAKIADQIIALADVETEGKNYSQLALVIPAGVGIKFKVNDFTNFNLEASYHYSLSDYLDDVSSKYASSYPDVTTASIANRKDEIAVVNQNAYDNILIGGGKRGNPKTKDGYLLLKFQLEFYLPPDLFTHIFRKESSGE